MTGIFFSFFFCEGLLYFLGFEGFVVMGFCLFFEKELKFGWVGCERGYGRSRRGEECAQNLIKFTIVLSNKNIIRNKTCNLTLKVCWSKHIAWLVFIITSISAFLLEAMSLTL